MNCLDITELDNRGPSRLEQRLNATQDFPTACRLAATSYRHTGNYLRAECGKLGLRHNAAFWFTCAEEALRACALAELYGQDEAKLIRILRKVGLECFAEALETGCYGEYLGF